VIDAPVLVALANVGRPRRPPGTRRAATDAPLEHADSATRTLGTFLGRSVDAGELDGLRRLAAAARRIADSLAEGSAPSVRELNRLAADCRGQAHLRVTPAGELEAAVLWETGPAAAVLARRVIHELGAIDASRLRRCASAECSLIFYDSSRSGTQRWHSEVPCGWRERQRRRRAQ
jgi:predicted RNA-binding Zn ribbon-like protein